MKLKEAYTPLPWRTNRHTANLIESDSSRCIAQSASGEDAAHIVRCVNAHDALVAACEAAIPELVAYSNSGRADYADSDYSPALRAISAAVALARESVTQGEEDDEYFAWVRKLRIGITQTEEVTS